MDWAGAVLGWVLSSSHGIGMFVLCGWNHLCVWLVVFEFDILLMWICSFILTGSFHHDYFPALAYSCHDYRWSPIVIVVVLVCKPKTSLNRNIPMLHCTRPPEGKKQNSTERPYPHMHQSKAQMIFIHFIRLKRPLENHETVGFIWAAGYVVLTVSQDVGLCIFMAKDNVSSANGGG